MSITIAIELKRDRRDQFFGSPLIASNVDHTACTVELSLILARALAGVNTLRIIDDLPWQALAPRIALPITRPRTQAVHVATCSEAFW